MLTYIFKVCSYITATKSGLPLQLPTAVLTQVKFLKDLL